MKVIAQDNAIQFFDDCIGTYEILIEKYSKEEWWTVVGTLKSNQQLAIQMREQFIKRKLCFEIDTVEVTEKEVG